MYLKKDIKKRLTAHLTEYYCTKPQTTKSATELKKLIILLGGSKTELQTIKKIFSKKTLEK